MTDLICITSYFVGMGHANQSLHSCSDRSYEYHCCRESTGNGSTGTVGHYALNFGPSWVKFSPGLGETLN